MKEYGIYIRQGSGTPYMLDFFTNIDNAKLKLYEMIQLEEERKRPYFVDNDFFNNSYFMVGKIRYFCIKEREVSEWKTYSEENYNYLQQDKIIYLLNHKK